MNLNCSEGKFATKDKNPFLAICGNDTVSQPVSFAQSSAEPLANRTVDTIRVGEYGLPPSSPLPRSRNPETVTGFPKPKIYYKERVRLKPAVPRKGGLLSPNGLMRPLIFVLVLVLRVTASEDVQNCPDKCSCTTFATPTVSSVQNLWPTLLTSALLHDTSITLQGPTTFEALISSILTTNDDPDNQNLTKMLPEKLRLAKTTKGYFQAPGGFSTSLINPGEVSIDCSNRQFNNLSALATTFDQQLAAIVVKLDLSSNDLERIRGEDLEQFSFLRYLNLATNQLTTLAEEDVPPLPNLILLSLHGNRIYEIHKEAFSNVTELRILDLTHNKLSEIPAAINKCSGLRQILLGDNRITYVKEASFSNLVNLQWVDLARNPLLDVHPLAFVGLPSLVKLILESVRDLDAIPSLNGTSKVEAIRIDRSSIKAVPSDICAFLPHLRSLNLHLNDIHQLPYLKNCTELRLLDLSNNKITDLGHKHFEDVSSLHDLLLQFNFIRHVSNDAFVGLTNLQVLNLEYNRITVIESGAFLPLINLEDINLGNNQFSEIPSVGLERVVLLKVHNNRHLRIFPGPESFPSVHSLILSYAYHCCPFLSRSDSDDLETSTEIQEDVVYSVDQLHKFDPSIWNHSNVWPHIEGIPTSEFLKVWAKQDDLSGGGEFPHNGTFPFSTKKIALLQVKDGNITKFIPFNGSGFGKKAPLHNIQCIPQPGPFMPCRDLFDWWTLRCGVWLVFLLALMGNGVVVVVLVSAYAKMDVPRFLVSNLALADFFMGIYLGFLAVVDASTLGDFRMYAIPWQMSAGCQLAGFLGVLSSELSVYTLTVITMERNYAITHAMHLNKRLSLKHAAYIMTLGWIFAVTMAVLPLTGISDYRKFAVCLPFETDGAGLGYIVFLMLINGLAFLILMGCYLKIYCAIRGSQAWNSNDSRIAKRMALLVFTDFICWAPIAFFSLSAAFGMQLISLEGAKVFTVFVLPLNSCCNPFLYALLTKQFKKDCVMLCKAIEESRVTRGIGRCRHSSNFSNRQTPVNTNSALDQNSKEDHGCSCKLKDHQNHKKNVAVRTLRFLCCQSDAKSLSERGRSSNLLNRSPLKMARATTLDSSKMNSSWSWRGQSASNLRLLELRRQTTLDLARKSSQESSLSSSRNDSSGTTGSTVTWGISRSSVSSDTSSGGKGPRSGSLKEHAKEEGESVPKTEIGVVIGSKPRLQRQRAVDKEPGSVHFSGNELRCPLHARGDNLSCVYEQASLEEEDSNEVFLVSPPPCHIHTHKRSLSDGLLCGTLLSLSAPTPQLISSIAPSLQLSKSSAKEKNAKSYSDSSEVRTESYDDGLSTDDAAKPADGLLETHFPVEASCEGDPLLHKSNK